MARRRILTAAAVGLALGLAYPASAPPPRRAPNLAPAPITDAQMFSAVVERVRVGESYYAAMATELRQNNYPTSSPFNWRTPVHLVALALAPWAIWRGLLTVLLISLFVTTMVTVSDRIARRVTGFMLLGIIVVYSAQDAVYVSEAWAGVLIGLSVVAFAGNRATVGVPMAVAALFIRELAAPYCVAATLIATWRRRWREVAGWLLGAAAYAIYYAWHIHQVVAHQVPSDFVDEVSWITAGGVPFLQATLTKLSWFALLPSAWTPVALAVVAGGLIAPGVPRHLRAVSAAYVGFFLVAGHAFNDYWGFIAAPAWAVLTGYALASASSSAALVPDGTRSSRC